MKTTKKILAALLVVMMLTMMIPFSASAAVPAGPYEATYVCAPNEEENPDSNKVGNYTFSFFKIADLEKNDKGEYTGAYKVVDSLKNETAIVNAINAAQSDTKSRTIITACDNLYKTNAAAFGRAATTISFSSTETKKTADLTDAGIYYIYCTEKPALVTSVNNSLVSLPYYSNNAWVDSYTADVNLATKVSTNPVDVTKTANKEYIGNNDAIVTYTLTATTAGSMENKLTKYEIVDIMDDGLTLQENTIVVKLDGTTLTKGTHYEVKTNHAFKDETGADKTATFAIDLAKYLNDSAFYAGSTVTVTYNAEIDDDARLNTAMPNTDGLVYGNESALNYEPGDTVNVFTYGVDVYKVNGANVNEALKGAEFTVYTEEAAQNPLVVDNKNVIAVTGDDGKATFKLDGSDVDFKFDAMDDAGNKITYYVKETKAPANFNISDTVYSFTTDTNSEYTRVNGDAIKNYPVAVPETGGMGTMLFTISGALLIACAGVLFFIVRRKKNA